MSQNVEVENPKITQSGPQKGFVQGENSEGAGEATPKTRQRILLAVVGALVVTAAFFAWRHFRQYESTDDAQIDGYIHPISTRVAGYVTHVYVDDNQFVKAGTVLAEIDPADYRVALESAKAAYANDLASAAAIQSNVPITQINTSSELTSAEAGVSNAQSGLAVAQQQYDSAQASLRQTEANEAKAQDDVKRYKILADKQEIAQQIYVQAVQTEMAASAAVAAARANAAAAKTGMSQAQQRLNQAQASLLAARTGPRQVSVTRARAQAALAELDRAKAQLDQAKLNLGYTTIVAPLDGVIGKRQVQEGQFVQPGQTLLSIVPLSNSWVTANFKETQLRHMRPGQPAVSHVDAFGKDFKGHVDSVAGATGPLFSLLPPENATGNYVKVVQRIPVKIVLEPGEDPGHLLRPGMSVEPQVKIQ